MTKSFMRAGHGAGRGQPHIEASPADELSDASPPITVRRNHGPDGRFCKANGAAKAAKVRPGNLGHLGLDRADPLVRPFLKWGRRYATHRRAELAAAHGGRISAGVGAMVESAGLALAASRYLHARGAETCDPELLKRASTLANDARQNELAAWELASREAKVDRERRRDTVGLPAWLTAEDAPPANATTTTPKAGAR